jgi:AcrR family transcriptional regulator
MLPDLIGLSFIGGDRAIVPSLGLEWNPTGCEAFQDMIDIPLDARDKMNERSFFLTVPKLKKSTQAERARRIEDGALALFTRRGFHGVGLRDIADEAGVSLGNIYNHFVGKEPIFSALMTRLFAQFAADSKVFIELVRSEKFPRNLEAVGRAIGDLVDRNRNYLTLVYVDMTEFDGKHARPHYENLAGRFRTLLGAHFQDLQKHDLIPRALDPAVAFTVVYMTFSNFFIVERRIGARHLGLDRDAAIKIIARILAEGLKPRRKK